MDDPKDNSQKITVARHGTALDEDEIWIQLPCNYEEVNVNKYSTILHN